MEIVKQRKRRLMAWILTIVLCVGMWQSNAMADEREGETVSENSLEGTSREGESTELGEGTNGESSTTINCYFYEKGVNEDDKEVYNPISFSVLSGTNIALQEWKMGESGFYMIGNGCTGTELSDIYIEGNIDENDTIYKHNVLQWRYTTSNKEEVVTEDGTLDLNEVHYELGDMGKIYPQVDAILGKSFHVSFGEWLMADSGGTYVPLGLEEEAQYLQGSEATVKIPMPEGGNSNGFFKGWQKIEDGALNGDIMIPGTDFYTAIYNKFEEELQFAVVYETAVSVPGTFYLYPGTKYTMSAGDWKVSLNNGAESDGYTYKGGQDFYIQREITDTTEAVPYNLTN